MYVCVKEKKKQQKKEQVARKKMYTQSQQTKKEIQDLLRGLLVLSEDRPNR